MVLWFFVNEGNFLCVRIWYGENKRESLENFSLFDDVNKKLVFYINENVWENLNKRTTLLVLFLRMRVTLCGWIFFYNNSIELVQCGWMDNYLYFIMKDV